MMMGGRVSQSWLYGFEIIKVSVMFWVPTMLQPGEIIHELELESWSWSFSKEILPIINFNTSYIAMYM